MLLVFFMNLSGSEMKQRHNFAIRENSPCKPRLFHLRFWVQRCGSIMTMDTGWLETDTKPMAWGWCMMVQLTRLVHQVLGCFQILKLKIARKYFYIYIFPGKSVELLICCKSIPRLNTMAFSRSHNIPHCKQYHTMIIDTYWHSWNSWDSKQWMPDIPEAKRSGSTRSLDHLTATICHHI